MPFKIIQIRLTKSKIFPQHVCSVPFERVYIVVCRARIVVTHTRQRWPPPSVLSWTSWDTLTRTDSSGSQRWVVETSETVSQNQASFLKYLSVLFWVFLFSVNKNCFCKAVEYFNAFKIIIFGTRMLTFSYHYAMPKLDFHKVWLTCIWWLIIKGR